MSLTKENKEIIVKEFGSSAQDTGSTSVQIASLSQTIKQLTGHCQKHPKDNSTRLGLLKMVCQRRRLLQYLERKDSASYKKILGRLGLKK